MAYRRRAHHAPHALGRHRRRRPAELIAVPLQGRDTKGPDGQGHGARIIAFSIPADPRRDAWPSKVLSEELHVTHNFWPTDFDGDGRIDILVASFEGVTLLRRVA